MVSRVLNMPTVAVGYEMPTASDAPVWDVWLSAQSLPALTAADELGIFDAIDAAPLPGIELARRMGLDERGTTALIRMLGAMGFVVVRMGRVHLTEVSRLYLRKASGHYSGAFIRVGRGAAHVQLLKALRGVDPAGSAGPNGRPCAGASGLPVNDWARGQMSLERARGLTDMMHAHSLSAALGLARAADFKDVRRFLDVGGGSGCFSIAMAMRNPDMRCTVMDLPLVCEMARATIAEAGMSARVDTHPADMFADDWPRGFDAIFFSNVLHDWSFESCRSLLRRAHDALPAGGQVCIHEMLLDDDGCGPAAAAAFSLVMFLTTQGQQFTAPELAGLLEEAGFGAPQIQATYGYYSLVSARRR
jgi:acetylserotonin N-methyltransferase